MFSFLKKKKQKAELEEYIKRIESAETIGEMIPPDFMFEDVVNGAVAEGITVGEYMRKYEVNSFGEPLDHLDEDGDLPWGWLYNNKQIIDVIKLEHDNHPTYTNWNAIYKKDPQAELEALKVYLKYIDELQARCDNIGECFGLWCATHLIGIGRKEFLDKRLAFLESNLDNLIQAHLERELMRQYRADLEAYEDTLTDEMMIDAIKQNEGMLQKDFCRLFPYPKAISNKLYWMAEEGKIERTKSGNSYILKVK